VYANDMVNLGRSIDLILLSDIRPGMTTLAFAQLFLAASIAHVAAAASWTLCKSNAALPQSRPSPLANLR